MTNSEYESKALRDAAVHGDPIVHALPGSQNVLKVLVAFNLKDVRHRIQYHSAAKMRKTLVFPYTVPQCDWADDKFVDSEDILKHIDVKYKLPNEERLFPEGSVGARVREVHDLASKDFQNYLLWYSWVDEEGFEKTIKPRVEKSIPLFAKLFCPCVVSGKITAVRDKVSRRCFDSWGEIDDPEKIWRNLLELVVKFDSLLESDDQQFLIKGTSSYTAADIAFFAMVERFVSKVAAINAAFPNLFDEAKTSRLKQWHRNMKNKVGEIRWKN